MNKSVRNFADSDRILSKGIKIDQNDSTLEATLPRGKVFVANSKSFLITPYANSGGQTWLTYAIHYLDGEISLGIRDATEDELAEYDHSNG
jgi:hypothetical protein